MPMTDKTVQVVIELPRDTYTSIKCFGSECLLPFEHAMLTSAFTNGCVELPKGHGRLIDADKFKKYFQESMADTAPLFKTQKYKALAEMVTKGICKDLDEAPVVVEADKEVEE